MEKDLSNLPENHPARMSYEAAEELRASGLNSVRLDLTLEKAMQLIIQLRIDYGEEAVTPITGGLCVCSTILVGLQHSLSEASPKFKKMIEEFNKHEAKSLDGQVNENETLGVGDGLAPHRN